MVTTDGLARQPALLAAAVELLWQLADDDMVVGFRDQEWLGLAPHIEEDVAFGSIGQEEIGHAAHYYGLLEQLGQGPADDLANLRGVAERRNSILLEQPNGAGDYLHQPHFDWAWTIVRHHFHDVWEIAVLTALAGSAWTSLADVSQKILGEKRYHRAHQELWIRTMVRQDGDSIEKLQHALDEVRRWAGDLADFGRLAPALEDTGILPGAEGLSAAFWAGMEMYWSHYGLRMGQPGAGRNGRLGEHTADLEKALATWSEVYRLDPHARW